jgi:hypothetical protein
MNNQIVLIVRFWVTARSKPLFVEKLKTLFEQIQHEATFVSASLQTWTIRNNFWSMKPGREAASPSCRTR